MLIGLGFTSSQKCQETVIPEKQDNTKKDEKEMEKEKQEEVKGETKEILLFVHSFFGNVVYVKYVETFKVTFPSMIV